MPPDPPSCGNNIVRPPQPCFFFVFFLHVPLRNLLNHLISAFGTTSPGHSPFWPSPELTFILSPEGPMEYHLLVTPSDILQWSDLTFPLLSVFFPFFLDVRGLHRFLNTSGASLQVTQPLLEDRNFHPSLRSSIGPSRPPVLSRYVYGASPSHTSPLRCLFSPPQ